jgi:HD-GYP domain-containing protein (c-di-GMP phosphodiesterase class II)
MHSRRDPILGLPNFPIAHSRAVARLAYSLAKAIPLPEEQARAIRNGAYLHDLGKVAIPPEILDKPGPLERHEWHVVYEHPAIGTRLSRALAPLSGCGSLILSHHERWDGNGYPNGLKGRQIPIASQIIAIADAFHAMTSDRPYRKALSIPAALQRIRECAGTQWSEEVVMALVRIVQAHPNQAETVPGRSRGTDRDQQRFQKDRAIHRAGLFRR